MTNIAKLLYGLTCNREEAITDETLRMVACPYDADDGAECDEYDGFPTEKMCAACKRKWLAMEAKQ